MEDELYSQIFLALRTGNLDHVVLTDPDLADKLPVAAKLPDRVGV